MVISHLIDASKNTSVLEENLAILDTVFETVKVLQLLDLRHDFSAGIQAMEHAFPDPSPHGVASG